MDSTEAPALRYRAFISYSHRDARITAKLHRQLESFRLPASLRAALPDHPGHLRPIFRDRDELASAERLSVTIEKSLDQSAALIVVCSPAAVASQWVGEEIRYFRRQHPQRPVFAFVVAGDPGLDPRLSPGQAAIPLPLLLEQIDQPTGGLGEPIAADARAIGDGFAAAQLKLIAGLLGLGYDQLRRREHQRQRQRWMLAGSASMALSLVFAWLAWEATEARDEARIAQARAELELASEQQTRSFLLSVFELADPGEARGEKVTVREVLDQAVARIDATHFDRAAIKSRYLATLGRAYSSLGLNKRSVELLEQSVAALDRSGQQPEAWSQYVDSQIELADVRFDMGDYAKGLAALDAIGSLPQQHEPTLLQRARAANVRGDILAFTERDNEALDAYEAALEALAEADLDDRIEAEEAGRSRHGLAMLSMYAGDHAEAAHGFADAVELLRRALGERHPATIATVVSRGSNAYAAGDLALARQSWSHALESAREVFDPDHPSIGTINNNLGRLLLETGDLEQAEPLLQAAVASDRKHHSAKFDDLAYSLGNLGMLLRERGEPEQARKWLEEALHVAEGAHHRMLGPLLDALADLECEQGQFERGAERAARAIAANTELHGANHWQTQQAGLTALYCARQAGQPAALAEARALRDGVIQRWPSAGNPFHRRAKRQFASMAGAPPADR